MMQQKETQRSSTEDKRLSKLRRKKVRIYTPRLSSSSSSSESSSVFNAEEEYDVWKVDSCLSGSELFEPYSEAVYKDSRSYSEKMDFFKYFGEIPDIEDISEDTSVVAADVVADVVAAKEVNLLEDAGEFVNPLSGLDDTYRISLSLEQKLSQAETISAVKSELKSKPEPEPEPEPLAGKEFRLSDLMFTESQLFASQTSELSELILPEDVAYYEESSDELGKMEDNSKDVLETLLEMVEVKSDEVVDKGIEFTAIVRERQARMLERQIRELLTELIYKIVNKCEFRTPEEILVQNLDKRKLLIDLAAKYFEFQSEVGYNQILERKIVDNLRRKKLYSHITQDRYATANKTKYLNAVWKIEEQLAKEKATKEKFETTKKKLLMELQDLNDEAKHIIDSFETLVKTSLSQSDERLNPYITSYLIDMRDMRKAISAKRYKLILIQDNHAKLLNKLAALENLDNGLTVTDYYNLLHYNQGLQKKLEERADDWNKLHTHHLKNLNIMAHIEATKARLTEVIKQQRHHLADLVNERNYLRHHIQRLQLIRLRTRQQIKEMSFNAGLLDKPSLMFDYDRTVEDIEKQKEAVARLKATLSTIKFKINILEKRVPNSTVTFSIR